MNHEKCDGNLQTCDIWKRIPHHDQMFHGARGNEHCRICGSLWAYVDRNPCIERQGVVMNSWKISRKPMINTVWRPILKIRVLPNKDLTESQSAGNFLALHNPDMQLLCYRDRTFVKIGPDAADLDETLKADKNMNLECPACGAVHNLHLDDDGNWATLSAPL